MLTFGQLIVVVALRAGFTIHIHHTDGDVKSRQNTYEQQGCCYADDATDLIYQMITQIYCATIA